MMMKSSGDVTSELPTCSQQCANEQSRETALNITSDEQAKMRKKKGICSFFQRSWRAVRRTFQVARRGNKVQPLMDQHPADAQPGPSGPEPTDVKDPGAPSDGQAELKPVSGPPNLEPRSDIQMAGPESSEPNQAEFDSGVVSGPSTLETDPAESEPAEHKPDQHQPDASEVPPVPGPSHLGQSPDTYLADPKPAGKFTSLYKKKYCLGSGLFSRVYEGTRKSDRQKVVIKEVNKRPTDMFINIPGYSEALVSEVALNVLMSKAPRSQHVVQMYQWFDEPKKRILILEYPHPCVSLHALINHNGGRLREKVARDLMIQALHGAKDCLERGVYHDDISMHNILVNTETLQLKLIDLGIGYFVSTDIDMSQYTGKAYPTEKSKWFRYVAEKVMVRNLADVLYRMVNGHAAFVTSEGFQCDHLVFHPTLSKECCDLLTRCLQKKPLFPVLTPSLQQVLEDEWFRGVELQQVINTAVGTKSAPVRKAPNMWQKLKSKFVIKRKI